MQNLFQLENLIILTNKNLELVKFYKQNFK